MLDQGFPWLIAKGKISVCRPGPGRRTNNSLAKTQRLTYSIMLSKITAKRGAFGSLTSWLLFSCQWCRSARGEVYRGLKNCQSFCLNFLLSFSDLVLFPILTSAPSHRSDQNNSRRTATVIGHSGRKQQGKSHKMSPILE